MANVLSIRWQWLVLCGAILIVLGVAVFTDELSPQTIERFSVDSKRWAQPHPPPGPPPPLVRGAPAGASAPPPAKMTEAEEEAAGLGHHVHTFHDAGGDVHAGNAKGVLPVADHHDVQKHLSKPASQPLEKFSFPQKLPEMPPPEMLLSEGAAVTTSVRGNLGPASTITDSKNADWLRDRWQAAKDMTGKPIPGPQWVMIDLGRRAQLTRLVLDWETAYGKAYTIEVSEDGKGHWRQIYHTDSAPVRQPFHFPAKLKC